MAARRPSIRDVGRVLDMPLRRGGPDRQADPAPSPNIDARRRRFEQEPDLEAAYASDPRVTELLDDRADARGPGPQRLDARRRRGDRAAAARRARAAVQDEPTTRSSPSTTWTSLEKLGLLKMDFLGLTHAHHHRRRARADRAQPRRRRRPRRRSRSTTRRPTTCFARGDTQRRVPVRVAGHARHAAALKPDRIEDLIALNALYRPGPDRRRHDRRLHRAQARPGAGQYYEHPRWSRSCRRPTASSSTRSR